MICGELLGASRRPTLALNRKLHNQIGFALRKYEKTTGAHAGRVRMKVRVLLTALHDDLLSDSQGPAKWTVKSDAALYDNGEVRIVGAVSPPPGLE